jgi:hypothetical protein
MNNVLRCMGSLGAGRMVWKRVILFGARTLSVISEKLRLLVCPRVVTASLSMPGVPPMQTLVGSMPFAGAPPPAAPAAPDMLLPAAPAPPASEPAPPAIPAWPALPALPAPAAG